MPSTFPEREPDEMLMPSGKPLRGAAAESARAYKARREADAAAARAIAPLARWNIRQAGGIDSVRSAIGRDAALEIAALAGLDTGRLSAEWAASDPARRQVSEVRPSQGYDRDPRHDPRVVKALVAGAPFSEINDLIKEAQDELLANPPRNIGPGGPYLGEPADVSAEMGVSYGTVRGPDGLPVRVPVQRSTDYKSWEALHAQDPAVAANGLGFPQPAPVNGNGHWTPPVNGSVTECSHEEAQDGHIYCSACGAPIAQAAAAATPPGGPS